LTFPKDFTHPGTELPGLQIQSDDELLDYARRNGSACYHATCLMGSHAMAVVDDELRVHGGYLDQHERADDHDRREGGGDEGAARLKNGGVAKAGGLELSTPRRSPARPKATER